MKRHFWGSISIFSPAQKQYADGRKHQFSKLLYAGAGLLLAGVVSVTAHAGAAARIDVTADAKFPVNAADTESDTANLQKILNQVRGATEEVEVYFPAGTYYVDQALRIYSYTHIVLDENATICRTEAGLDRSILHNVDDSGNMDKTGGYDMSHDIIIEGGIWDGGDVSAAESAADVIRIDHAENITVRNCIIKNVYDCHLLELIGVKNGLVENCTFSDFYFKKGQENNYLYAREALQLETAWTNTEDDPEQEPWANGSVVDGTSCQSVTVTNCTFDNVPCGVGQHHFTESGEYRNQDIEISNNTLTYDSSAKNGKTAINCCGTDNLRVFGNRVSGGYQFGIHLEAADEVSITNNQFQQITMNGIMVDGGNVTAIDRNTLKNITKHGISCGGGSIKSISGNQISGISQNGICVDDGAVTLIKSNTIKNVKKSGISVVGGKVGTGKRKTDGLISNIISGCKLNGITISGRGTVSAVAKNKVTNVKNNGISLTDRAKVAWVVKNKTKKCKKHDIWNGLKSKVRIQK